MADIYSSPQNVTQCQVSLAMEPYARLFKNMRISLGIPNMRQSAILPGVTSFKGGVKLIILFHLG